MPIVVFYRSYWQSHTPSVEEYSKHCLHGLVHLATTIVLKEQPRVRFDHRYADNCICIRAPAYLLHCVDIRACLRTVALVCMAYALLSKHQLTVSSHRWRQTRTEHRLAIDLAYAPALRRIGRRGGAYAISLISFWIGIRKDGSLSGRAWWTAHGATIHLGTDLRLRAPNFVSKISFPLIMLCQLTQTAGDFVEVLIKS